MSTTFITAQSLGTLRNNFTGRVGFRATLNKRIIIRSLGRWVVAGNSQTHLLTVYQSGTLLASVTVNCSGATAAAYLYGTLSPAIYASGTIDIESAEVNASDQWYDSNTTLTPTGDGTVDRAIHDGNVDVGTGAGHSYVPTNFQYDIFSGDWTADFGYYANRVSILSSPSLLPTAIRSMALGNEYQIIGGKETSEGNPATPCLRLDNQGRWRFRWAVASGTRTVQVNVKQAINSSPRPTLVVKANPDIGINADSSATAGSGTGWVTIGPITITPSSDGAVWVEVWNNLITQVGGTPCFVDHIVTT